MMGLRKFVVSYMALAMVYVYVSFGQCLNKARLTGKPRLCYWLGIALIAFTVIGFLSTEGFVIEGGSNVTNVPRVAAIGDLGKSKTPSGFVDVGQEDI